MADRAADSEGKRVLFRGSRNLMLSNLASRVLGFFREMTIASVLGGGAFASAWFLTSMLANSFRRTLGEGELGKAIVPLLVYTRTHEGEVRAKEKFTTILLYAAFALTVISLAISIPSYFAGQLMESARWRITFHLIPLIMPYTVLICLVGVMTACANSVREFFLPSLTAILQNMVLIAALFLLCPTASDGMKKLEYLTLSVLAAGVLELVFMLWILKRKGLFPIIRKRVFTDRSAVRETLKLAAPGMIGASALQLSTVADSALAGFVGDYGVASINFCNRLILLPIGVFAVSFATVANTEMSRCAAEGRTGDLMSILASSVRVLLLIALPLTLFMWLFGEELLRLFYFRGAFTETALREASYTLAFYVFGIPSFTVFKVMVIGFTARKNMMTPFRIAMFCLALNFCLNIVLMFPLKQGGIVLATVLTSFLNNILLLYYLNRELPDTKFPLKELSAFLMKTVPAAVLALIPAWLCYAPLNRVLPQFSSMVLKFCRDAVPIGTAGLVYLAVFAAFCMMFRVRELRVVTRKFIR